MKIRKGVFYNEETKSEERETGVTISDDCEQYYSVLIIQKQIERIQFFIIN